jgi:tRNA threonylcarbamoyl adenosine modification protein (Sua5/YciO/YrdC/YwlC family)
LLAFLLARGWQNVDFPFRLRPLPPPIQLRLKLVVWYISLSYHHNREGHCVRAEILKIQADQPEASLVKYAAEQIRAGRVLGMPTDTFYGLAADPFNLRAVERVYEIKSRSRHKPLSLLIENVDQAEEFARPLPEDFHILARRFWPGPLTMIVPAASHLPLKVTANTGNVALRVPAAEIPLAVVRAAGIPITATSANLSGAAECTTADQVREQLGERISIIVDGGASPRAALSTIVQFNHDESWHVLREGAVPAKDIAEALS